MTPEELLKPRYKAIADYPGTVFKIGDILIEGEKDLIEAAKYPHLFKKLEWWEERKEKDMPEYVKISEFPHKGEFIFIHVDGKKAAHKFNPVGYFGIKYKNGGGTYIGTSGYSNFLPTTESEYLNQKK